MLEAVTVERPAKMVEAAVKVMYHGRESRLPFHGWHHISFVRTKAVEYAELNGADVVLVEISALVHDLNYIVKRNSDVSDGAELRRKVLTEVGIGVEDRAAIEKIVREAETAQRHRDISLEAQALSDADTLFKALPFTPVLLSKKYMDENGVDILTLARKIVGEQAPLDEQGIYFYNQDAARKFWKWSRANLDLWRCILESLDDPEIAELARELS